MPPHFIHLGNHQWSLHARISPLWQNLPLQKEIPILYVCTAEVHVLLVEVHVLLAENDSSTYVLCRILSSRGLRCSYVHVNQSQQVKEKS